MSEAQSLPKPGSLFGREHAHADIEVGLILRPEALSLVEELNLGAEIGDAVARPEDLLQREADVVIALLVHVVDVVPMRMTSNSQGSAPRDGTLRLMLADRPAL